MSAYLELRDALFELVDDLYIAPAFDEEVDEEDADWQFKLTRPPKSDELQAYPSFSIVPFRDQRSTADSVTDTTGYTFLIRIYVGWDEADSSEDLIHGLVQIVRQALINERVSEAPLDGLCYDLTFSGMWSGDETQGERIYQLEVTCYVTEEFEELEEPDP